MRFKHSLVAAICLISLAVAGPAFSGIVGPAGDYNVFVFGDFSSHNEQTHGNLAAGGNVKISYYKVATDIDGSNGARLDAGGSVTASDGDVGISGTGMIYTSNASGIAPNFNSSNNGSYSPSPINFSAAETYYQNLSTSWSTITPNGDQTVESYPWYTKLTLEGDDPSLNVFLITGDLLKDVVDLIIDAPTDSTVLINVSGTAKQTFVDGSVTLQGGIDSSHIIYNFFESTALELYSGKNLKGSVLAPYAAVTSNGGELDGQLIAGSFDGRTQFHNVPFTGTVPLPAAAWLFAPAFGFLSILSRRRKQTN